MSVSRNVAEQRDKDQKVFSSFLIFSFIASVVLHIVVVTLSSLWLRTPKLVEEPIKPIEVMVIEPSPSLQTTKPKQKTEPKSKPIAIGGSQRKSSTPSVRTITVSKATSSGSQKNGTLSISSTPSDQLTASKPASASLASPQVISKKPSNSTEIATRQKAVATKPPKLIEAPKPKSIPVATLPPTPVETPKLAQTLPTLQPPKLTPITTSPPTPIESPKPTSNSVATLPSIPAQAKPTLKQASAPSPIPTATLEPRLPSQPPVPVIPSPPQDIARNSIGSSDNPDGVGKRKSVAIDSGNTNSRGFTRGNDTRDSGQSSSPSNGSGSSLGTGNSSGNTGAVAIGPRSGNGNGLTTGSGSGSIACRRCPPPDYPPRTENLEGRAVVEIDIDKDGNVNDVQIVKSTGHDILDQRVLETVKKKWKFASSDNKQRVKAAVNFAMSGSDFYHQARERERQAHEFQQHKKREHMNRKTPVPLTEFRETPTPESIAIPETLPQPIIPNPAPFKKP